MADFVINTKAGKLGPSMAGLANGQFVAVWSEVNSHNINGRRFDRNGRALGPDFRVNTADNSQGLPIVYRLLRSPGDFVVSWVAGRNVLVQRFNADGSRLGEEIRANTTDVNVDHPPALNSLLDGNFVVAWSDARLDVGVRARIFTPEGRTVGNEIKVNSSTGVNFAPVMTELDDAGFVIAWRGGRDVPSAAVRFQIFNPDGSKSGTEHHPNIRAFGGDFAIGLTITEQIGTEPGHFAIAHIASASSALDQEKLVVVTLFGPGGSRKGAVTVTHREDQSISRQVALRALPNRQLIVAWTEKKIPDVGDRTEENIMAMLLVERSETRLVEPDSVPPVPPSFEQVFFLANDGRPAIRINSNPVGVQHSPCLALSMTNEGDALVGVGWNDDSVSGSAANVRAVKGNVLSHALGPISGPTG
jgi:hypothetical protein